MPLAACLPFHNRHTNPFRPVELNAVPHDTKPTEGRRFACRVESAEAEHAVTTPRATGWVLPEIR